MSTSLRGRELKLHYLEAKSSTASRPPCEVVSWNTNGEGLFWSRPGSTSLRGRELKCCSSKTDDRCCNRRPPCEVVSWNVSRSFTVLSNQVDLLARSWVEIAESIDQQTADYTSTSLRGRELKFLRHNVHWVQFIRRPPCEVVSWNTIAVTKSINALTSTSLRGRELKWSMDVFSRWIWRRSTSLRGRELKWFLLLLPRSLPGSTSLWGRELK